MGGTLLLRRRLSLKCTENWIKVQNKTSKFEHFTSSERLMLVSTSRRNIFLHLCRIFFSETICQRESFFSYLSLNLTELKVCLCCKFKQPNYSFRDQTDNVAPEKLWNWERGFGVWGPFPMSTVLCPTLFQNWNKSNFIVKFKSMFFNLKLPQLTTYIFYNIKNIFCAWGLFLIFRFRQIYSFWFEIGEKYIVTIFKCIWCLRAISYV